MVVNDAALTNTTVIAIKSARGLVDGVALIGIHGLVDTYGIMPCSETTEISEVDSVIFVFLRHTSDVFITWYQTYKPL
ncbi:MAG: hypothetical protein GFH27_549357n70 [Chloroflexi bacterium AL-W]|nr:hypothetical protein [Chloroflexi bacterium AL-N10]NOK78526.1 hypothetical protein [Chloroflexi bacterium AL-N5]NOK85610.1 hypothetical protein [Chloroflexi bacterium AL-W]NOK92524.1 hypothetical protein [Chloroflexi bacterium AL-N15]